MSKITFYENKVEKINFFVKRVCLLNKYFKNFPNLALKI